MIDDDSTWNPPVAKKKVTPQKTFKTISNSNICVKVSPKVKEKKLLDILIQNKQKLSATNLQKLIRPTDKITYTIAETYCKTNGRKAVEVVAVRDEIGNNNTHVVQEEV